MNESLPPEGRRVSYKSLDSEAMAAARRAAEASGISLQEWLSRTILENARRSGLLPDNPSRDVAGAGPTGQANAEDAVQAIARHLERAKSAADQQGLSLAEWLSRAILTNAQGGTAVARRPEPENKPAPPTLESAATLRTGTAFSLPPAGETDEPAPAPAARTELPPAQPARSRSRVVLPEPEKTEPALPEASTVRDVLARTGSRSKAPRAAAATPDGTSSNSDSAAAAARRRRRTLPLAAALGALVLIAAGVWAVPMIMKSMKGESQEATAADPPKNETAALPDAKPDAKPAEAPNRDAPAKPPEAAKPEDRAPPPPAAKPVEKADAAPPAAAPPAANPPAASPPPQAAKPDSKPADKPLPEPGDDLAKVPAKDMPKPPSAHVDWYRKAAEADNAEAQYTLAELYLKGDGVGRDYRQAAQLFRRAAEKGNLARAQYALGLLHQRGLGVLKNDVEAVLWWQKAADQNYSAAITHVGIALLEGRGIAKDEEAARKALERAAELDEPHAQYTLGRIYERGIGTKKDPVVAMKWFILAAEQAHQQATQKVEELSTSLPRDLQERATELVSEHYRRFRRRT